MVRFGFGGACFPKDTSALANYAENLNVNMEILEKAISLNNDLRSAYNEQTKRERTKYKFKTSTSHAQVVELVDTRDLKSLEGNFVPVQVRLWAPSMYIIFT